MTQEQAKDHPRKNIITRALGVSADIETDYYQDTLDEGDVIIICTDGLTNYLRPMIYIMPPETIIITSLQTG